MGTRTGLAVRLGPVTFGTSSMYPYRAFLRGDGFGSKDISGLDAYVMVRIPVAYKRIKDRDADKVSDRKDQCIKVPGTWEYRGCPDRDGDHIRDEEDECPDVPGLAKLHGCPDKDGDGVTDLKDDCPEVAGLVELKGCPDKDGDGITDSKDDCPDDKGLASFNGCPDRDSDGVMDRIDDCPDTKGLVQYNGCPDTDGDNIIDKVDACPTVYGIAELKGCPAAELTHFNVETQIEKVKQAGGVYSYGNAVETKTAKFKLEGYNADTVKTVFVTAPNLRGKNAYREADGFFRFAKEAEVIILKEEEKQVMKKAFENLEFRSTSDVILSSSFASLNELAQLMISNPTWKLRISGHTDNVGSYDSNMNLSIRRSESVRKYLVSKGLAMDRFEVFYFGPDKPIAPNDTEEGKARNRRVEMLLVE
jgi:outer membrane protein OmpA-like peptidoglycan-associated protein